VHDVTLRDGEQQAGVAFNKEEKVEIARLLDEAGVDRIEAGFPAVSKGDFEAIKTIANMGLRAKVFSFARCMKNDVDTALQCGVEGVALEIPSSDHLLRDAYKWPEKKAVELAVEATAYAHDHGLYVAFFTIDSTRAEFDTCWRLISSVAEKGHMDSLVLVDTFGVCSPQAIGYLVSKIRKLVKQPLEIHVHNDFGLGVANTIAGVLAGAETVHVSVNGIGERTGNASLEQTVMALKQLYGVESNIRYEKLRKVSKGIAEFARVYPPPQAPIVGDGIFTIESGIVAGWWNNVEEINKPLEIFPFLPSLVGHDPIKVVMGKKSGRDSVLYKAKKLGMSLTEERVTKILERVKSEAVLRKRSLSDREFEEILRSP
jgi:isopropylmalate/homocitrate/citramalate synthase